ncbi:cation:proton antiporter [Sphingorhabdus sp.]|uniref:cation:proton antiporter n=2 Tax=Sphingorhabdus sp. TaxID=1902408 RepID=UPI003C74BF01
MDLAALGTLFFLQVTVILAVARITGYLAQRYLMQPRVVGEMIAGVLLGPSLFGAFSPDMQAALFPADTRPILYVIAQMGVGLYMFIVGLGFDRKDFAVNAKGAAIVSVAGMAAPFLAAVLLVPWLLQQGGLFGEGIDALQATLFLGAAIAITAFPMLARIIHERGITGTTEGTIALSAGAIGDAGAWVLVAIVLATLNNNMTNAGIAVGGGLAFAAFMIFLGPRFFAYLGRRAEIKGVDNGLIGIALILYMLSAFFMDAIGIHAVFGGFLLGTAMPRGKLSEGLKQALEPVTVVLLLPFFFTYSGLHTDLRVAGGGPLLWVALVILLASVLAKGGASYLAARWVGQSNRSALGIGALMNARGLMELIIINIGLQSGVIEPSLFSILVLMAIVTTLMASPLFELSRRIR